MMNDATRVIRRPQRGWRPAAAIPAAAALVLLAACGGSPANTTGPSNTTGGPSNTTGGTAHSQSAVAFSQCMRSHGLPDYPDPDSSGTLPKASAQLLGVSSSVFDAAQRACQPLLPATGGSLTASSIQQCYLAFVCPQALVQQALSAGRVFAQCMRSHGVPYWPDPTVDAQGRPLFNINVPRPQPAQVTAAGNECTRLDPAGSLLAYG
jgi:hypothetical protein